MWRVKKQNEDLKTEKVREDIQVSMTDKEYRNLKLLAYKVGLKSEGELLSSFVGDLIGWRPNGSDERDLANRWYERTFSTGIGYFRHFLFIHKYDLDTIKNILEDADFFKEVYEVYKYQNDEMVENKERCLKVLNEIIMEGKEL